MRAIQKLERQSYFSGQSANIRCRIWSYAWCWGWLESRGTYQKLHMAWGSSKDALELEREDKYVLYSISTH